MVKGSWLYTGVDILCSWAASIKPLVSPFKFGLLRPWCTLALFTSALSVLRGYFLFSGFSFHIHTFPYFSFYFHMSSKLAFLTFSFISLAAFVSLVNFKNKKIQCDCGYLVYLFLHKIFFKKTDNVKKNNS